MNPISACDAALRPGGAGEALRTPGIWTLAVLLGSGLVQAQTTSRNQLSPDQLFQEALAAQERGDDAVAVSRYRELLRLHPEAESVRVNLGATLAHEKHFDQAIEQYSAVLKADPSNRLVRLNLVMVYQDGADLTDAIKELERLHREDPGDRRVLLLLGDSYLKAGRDADSISLLLPLESAQPDDLELEWLLGRALIHAHRLQDGVERVEKVAESSTNADAFLLAGQTRFSMNQFDLARRDSDAAVRLNPAGTGVATLDGMVREQTADYDGAETALLQAVAADAKDFNAHFYLGAIYYFKRDMPHARLHLTQALSLQPQSAQVRYELARVAHVDGNLDEERKELETVVQQTPDWLQPHIELAALYFRLRLPEDGARQREIVDRMMATLQATQSEAAH
ncbi:MAG TPA: tetratricopeptide repeat protein [Acidisarcina sp.]